MRKYVYDMHVHSSEGSACGNSPVRDMVRAFAKAGYSGFVLTDHFVHGNTAIPKNLPWERRMRAYYAIYEEAKEEAADWDIDVMFGLEHAYERGKEVLTYGIDLAFLLAHPELEQVNIDTYVKLVHEEGGLCFQAHPYRWAFYIPEGVEPRLDIVDGLEVFNACNPPLANEKARQAFQKRPHLLLSSGSDAHATWDTIGFSGLAFPERIRSGKELVKALKARQGEPIEGKSILNYIKMEDTLNEVQEGN